ncbi:MAG: hypothetical protein IKZ87_00600 [Actinomycetaceae bacterium]|nr:hypothetical protein [Actinomycetaceae bacterium]
MRKGLYKYVVDGEIIYIGMSDGKTCGIDERITAHAGEEKFKPYLDKCEIYFYIMEKPRSVIKAYKTLLINQHAPLINVDEKPTSKDNFNYELALGIDWIVWKQEEYSTPSSASPKKSYVERVKKMVVKCEQVALQNYVSMENMILIRKMVSDGKYEIVKNKNSDEFYVIESPFAISEYTTGYDGSKMLWLRFTNTTASRGRSSGRVYLTTGSCRYRCDNIRIYIIEKDDGWRLIIPVDSAIFADIDGYRKCVIEAKEGLFLVRQELSTLQAKLQTN